MGATDPDPYALLEVSPDADAAAIKRAYRRLAREWHPDRNPAPEAAERFKQIARAWEILGDPVRRRVHDGRTTAARDGVVPEEHVDAVADAIERAQRWIEEVVVPHYASQHRGAGAEMSARWVRDLPTLDPARLQPMITWRGRRRARKWLARASVRFDRGYQPTTLLRAPGGFVIGVSPLALWEAGFRGPLGGGVVELDDAVLRLLSARYAQALCSAFQGPAVETDEGWQQAIDLARARDTGVVWSERFWQVVWTAVALLLAFMLGSAWIGW